MASKGCQPAGGNPTRRQGDGVNQTAIEELPYLYRHTDILIKAYRNSIAERLLDGLLAANGVIDRHAVEAALRTDERDDNSMFGRILDLLEAENWARSWTR